MIKIFFKSASIVIVLLVALQSFGQVKQLTQPNIANPFKSKINQNVTTFITPRSNKNVAGIQQDMPKIVKVNGSFHINFEKYKKEIDIVTKNFNHLLNLNEQHSFKLISERIDEFGITHSNFQQLFKGFPIEGSIIMMHSKNDIVTHLNGQIAEFDNINTEINITPLLAKEKAMSFLKVTKLLNDYPFELVILKIPIKEGYKYKLTHKIRIDSYSPFVMCNIFIDPLTGEIINKIDLINDADTPGTASTLYSGTKAITIDSYNGSYRLRESTKNIQTYNATNATFTNGIGFSGQSDYTNSTTTWTGVPYLSSFTITAISQSWWYTAFSDILPDLYIIVKDGANQTVYTANYINNTTPPVTFYPNIILQNPPYTVEIWDYDAVGGDDFGGSYSITTNAGSQTWNGNGNNGTYTNSLLNNPALDVHWGMEKTYDFYQSVFNRNSYDGNGSVIKNYINPSFLQAAQGNSPNNAFAMPSPYNVMCYGMGDASFMSPVVGLDVEGHEYSHMVIANNGNGGLTYQAESGALNESFADIFGTCVEFYGATSPNWTIGENVVVSSPYYLRSMSNPNSGYQPQPDTYEGQYWQNITNLSSDQGGVHTNSGVQNFWFYLLCQGGSGTNDLGNTYSVTGIGILQARKIAYKNLITYLTPNATYYDAYLGSLQAAQDLYGNPSSQYTAVRQAWYAVGIGNNPNNYCSGTTNLTASSGTITDGSGSANYNNNANCKWIIAPPGATQITLNFTNFDTEANYDTVFVYNGPDDTFPILATWWGNTLPPTINSTGGALCIKFTSDATTTATGWSATYSSIGITPTCNGGTILSAPSGSFNDGSGTSNYGNNQFCYWFITPPCANSVTLSFTSFNTELNYDGIIIYDDLNTTNQIAVLSGTTIPTPVTSNTGIMVVVFVSDFSTTFQGFNANYTSTGSAYCSGTTTLNSNDAGTFNDGSGTNNYCNNQNCSWLIQPPQATSVTLSFSAFDVESASQDGATFYDAVEVYNGINSSAPLLGRFTGNTIPPLVTSTSGSMFVKFYSDISVTKSGWTANYTSTTTTYCTGTTNLVTQNGTITDGSGINNYGNNSNCSWYIHPPNATSITLTFIDFNTELNHDGVIIFDGSNNSASILGQYSGTSIPSAITSTGGNMYIEFLTDQSTRASGWTANYNSTIADINNNLVLSSLKCYPNPVTNELIIESIGNKEKINFEIFNSIGQSVYKGNLIEKTTVQTSSFTPGIYIIKLNNGKVFEFKKIVKE